MDGAVQAEIQTLKERVDNVEERIDKNIEKMWEKIDSYRENQIITHVLVETLNKTVVDMRVDLKNLVEKSNIADKNQSNKWEAFWSKASWGLIGILVTVILTKIGLN